MNYSFPNLFIPGAGKSGTSSLHELLNFHPEICMSSIKEPHFWTKPNFNNYTLEEKEVYFSLFNSENEVHYKGESSTGYMQFPKFIERIKKHYNQDPKFIFILRNPINRCYSHYSWLKGIGSEKESFRNAILSDYSIEPSHETNLPEGNYKNYFQFGLYGKWLSRFYENFNSDTIKVITYENLIEDRLSTMNNCFKFLNISELDKIPEMHSNKTVVLKHPYLYKFSKRIAFQNFHLPKFVRDIMPQNLKLFFRKKLMTSIYKHTQTNRTYPEISKNDRAFLKEHYINDISKLKKLTGLEFNKWTDFNN